MSNGRGENIEESGMMDYRNLIEKYQDMRYFETDPVAVVRRCSDVRDIEVMGVVCSWLALGNRNQIFKHCCRSYELMNGKPYQYVMSREWAQYQSDTRCYYRMFAYRDFHDLMNSLYRIYDTNDTLEGAVIRYCATNPGGDYLDALISLFDANGIPRSKASACKRLCLFLRWMIRRDTTVDLGIWRRLDPKRLLIPLDVHVSNIAREHGLIHRNPSDMKTVVQLTDECKQIVPDDPCAMDFALFGLGYTGKNQGNP